MWLSHSHLIVGEIFGIEVDRSRLPATLVRGGVQKCRDPERHFRETRVSATWVADSPPRARTMVPAADSRGRCIEDYAAIPLELAPEPGGLHPSRAGGYMRIGCRQKRAEGTRGQSLTLPGPSSISSMSFRSSRL